MSEIVVYTALAVVFSRHDDAQLGSADADDDDDGVASDAAIVNSKRRNSGLTHDHVEGGGVLWRPVADGAWTQLHLFLEMERDASHDGSPRNQLMRNFRLVAWVLETGKVIVNDVMSAKCMWAPIDELLWQFTSADGHCYGFRFHSVEQADECAQVVGGILNNIDEIQRLVKKMFETRTTTREFLALLYDIGFFKLDSSRRTTMIESAHAAVASLQAQPDWPRSRRGAQPIYPKEKIPEFTEAAIRQNIDTRVAAAAAADPCEEETRIMMKSAAKRSSNHHLLAQFTEVQKAALAATQSQIDQTDTNVFEDSESDGTVSQDDETDAGVAEVEGKLHEQVVVVKRQQETTSRSTVIDTSEMSITGCHDSGLNGLGVPKDCISMPYKTRQELHVTYNKDLARYEGLPSAWRRLNHQFGLPLEAVPKRLVAGYPKKIPAVLQMLKELLLLHDGLHSEGIFRLAPDKARCAEVKQSINDGTFTGCNDVHILANLIKVWFRELPQSLFNAIPEKHIYRTCEMKDPQSIMSSIDVFPPLYASLVKWLLDLMAEVAKNEECNKMTARNLGEVVRKLLCQERPVPPTDTIDSVVSAIVISPNLFSITSDNPMYALTMSQKVAEFTFVLLDARLRYIR